jgi:hypothetical protein
LNNNIYILTHILYGIMSQKYKTISVNSELVLFIEDCEFVYRQAHPEFALVPLSKSKILYEVIKFYLKGTEKDFKYREGLL